MRIYFGVFAALLILATGCGGDGSAGTRDGKIVLHLTDDPTGKAHEVNADLVAQFEELHPNVKVEFVSVPASATERLALYLRFLGARSSDVDVYQIDVIWPGILDEHLLDLSEDFPNATEEFFPPIVENNTVNGRLVGIPWFADAGMLYYRSDLLEKYGYENPPQTWDELEKMAARIQEGERAAGIDGIYGYVWQGSAYEGLTCNIIEWIASRGGGHIIELDGTITINNPNVENALKDAADWPGSISPPGVLSYKEEEARNVFHTGRAVFMRNWPYAYSLMNTPESDLRGKFDVAMLPTGGEGHASALGGWQLAVSKYSEHQKEALELVRFLSSAEAQKKRAINASLIPTRPELYDDNELLDEIPFLGEMKDIFLNAVARPSTVSGNKYNQVSSIVFRNVHRVLSGELTANEALFVIEEKLEELGVEE